MASTLTNELQQDEFADVSSAPDNFQQQFNLDQPAQAMTSYQKLMHQHTKQQFEIATASSRRSSKGSIPSLSSEKSTASSLS